MEEEKQPLKEMANAFKELANSITSQIPDRGEARIELCQFSRACSFISPIFRHLGIALKFVELDYVSKADDLVEASKSILTVPEMIDGDIKTNCVRKVGSHTRNLLRVKRGINMIKVLFEHLLVTEGNSLKDPASKAYFQVFAPHHGWAIRKAAAAGIYALTGKAQLLKKLNEDETSSRIHMQVFIASASPVIMYVDQLFMSRELGINW